VLLVESYYTYQ